MFLNTKGTHKTNPFQKTYEDREEALIAFVNSYFSLTNKELFDFIKEYGESSFFVDLWCLLNIPKLKNRYAEIAHSYHVVKHYFETH